MYAEGKREIWSVFIGPVVWFLVAGILVALGLLQEEFGKIYFSLAFVNVLSGLITFFISYYLVFKSGT